MLELGAAFIVIGLYWWWMTSFGAKSEEDVHRSLEIEEQNRRRLGTIVGGWANQFEWSRRATFRHPILMRLLVYVPLVVGAVLVVVDLST